MATIKLYADKINQMPGLIKDVKLSVGSYKAELAALQKKSLSIRTDICNMDDVISSLQSSTQTQEEKLDSLEALSKNVEQFVGNVVRIDNEVADLIKQRKDEFFDKYSYLKPDYEKSWLEDFGDSVVDWCKEHWDEVLITVAIVLGAAFAIAAVALTWGMALAPLLAVGLGALGMASGTALTIASATSAIIATIAITSTVASAALDVVDTWHDMSGNPTFKTWQSAMSWISMASNTVYGGGAMYNAAKGISTASLREYGKEWLTNPNFRSAIRKADEYNLNVQPNSSTFWAGLGEDGKNVAKGYAIKDGRVTLESTIESQRVNMPAWSTSEGKEAWRSASASYAMNSSGNVKTILGREFGVIRSNEKTIEKSITGNTWQNTERIILNINPRVTSVSVNNVVIPRAFQWDSFYAGTLSLGSVGARALLKKD